LEHDLRLDVPAPTPESPSMTMAIEAYIKKVNK
jgi:uroporphyrinogen-III synthase